MKNTIHLAIRISDKMYGVENVVHHHYRIAFSQGGVWFGKPFAGIAKSVEANLNEQIKKNIPTALYIFDKDPANKVVYEAELLAVSLRSPKEKELIPSFYKDLKILSQMKAWFKVAEFQAVGRREYPQLETVYKRFKALDLQIFLLGAINNPEYLVLGE
jgi:hypothetical protein